MKRFTVFFAAICSFCSFHPSFGAPIVVENGPQQDQLSSLVGFGWRPPRINAATEYFAQTFQAPDMAEHLVGVEIPISAGISPDSFGHATDADLLFRLLIVEDLSTETSGFKPGELLYETTTLRSNFVELRQGVTQIFNVSIPSVDVEPGRSYAFVLDAVADMPADGFGWRSVPATMDSFDQGEFYSLRIDRDAQHAPIGSRTDHFQDEWLRFDHSAIDMQFRLEFVPEPGAFELFGLALAFFWVVCHRIMR